MPPTPILLPTNRPRDRFYRGGARIDAFRGQAPGPEYTPEDWIASVTPLAGETDLGRTLLPDGHLLADAIAGDRVHWLGPDHVARFGGDPMLLVKLLDAGQRLPVHAHPSDAWAAATLGAAHGKAEAWVILTPGVVHLGLRRDVPAAELSALVSAQDTAALIALLHERPVDAGDVVLVPPGVLHAIGEGVLLLEVQQPADLSILLEWRDFGLAGAGDLGVGIDRALTAVETRARAAEEIDALTRPGGLPATVLPAGAEAWFRVERVEVAGWAAVDAGFAVLVVVDGEVRLEPDLALCRGSTVLLPWSAGPIELTGTGAVLIARPPRP